MILLTGASGFVGQHLLMKLIERHGIENVVALTSKPLPDCRYILHHGYTFEPDHFLKSGYDISLIVHSGAFTPKNAAEANDVGRCSSNVYSTDVLLRSNLPSLEKIVFLSTLDVYGDTDTITEMSIVKPVSLYGLSKAYCERMVEVWAANTGKRCQILRLGHVYGPGEEAYQKVIPVALTRLLKGEPLQLSGTGDEARSFIFVKDVVNAILNAIGLNRDVGVINVAGGDYITIRDLFDVLMKVTGRHVPIEVGLKGTRPRSIMFDNTKMKELLLPEETPLEAGLKAEWDYLRALRT